MLNELGLTERVILKRAGSLAEMALYYNGARLLVYPSLYEGFGLPPLEAMACGCPVLTSNNSSLQEIFKDAALLVDPKSTDEFADKILEAVSNEGLRNRLIERGLALSKKLTRERMVRGTLDVYEKVLRT